MTKGKKIEKGNVADILRLTPMQEGMLYQHIAAPDSELYFEQLSLRLSGTIDRSAFRKAWQWVLKTNEMLRTVFAWEKLDRPVQIVLKEMIVPLREVDLTQGLTLEEQEGRLAQVKEADRQQQFDLIAGPLWRVTLCQLASDEYEMILSNHHLIYDGWSLGIILQEFFTGYQQLMAGESLPLVKKKPFKDYLRWLQQQEQGAEQERATNFWRDYLYEFGGQAELGDLLKWRYRDGASMDAWAGNDERQDGASMARSSGEDRSQDGHYLLTLTPSLTQELEEAARRERVSLGTLLYTAWGLVLQRYTNQSDIVFGTTLAGRPPQLTGIEEMVGLFINTLPLRIHTTGEERVGELLRQVQTTSIQREAFMATPLVEIQSFSETRSQNSLAGLFDTIIAIENYPLEQQLLGAKDHSATAQDSSELANRLQVQAYSIHEQTEFPLTIGVQLFDQIQLDFHYDREVVHPAGMARLAGHWQQMLLEISSRPEAKVADLELLTPVEREQILFRWNETKTAFPREKTLPQLFEEQVALHPKAQALVWDDKSITYQQLNEQANQLARRLRDKGVRPGQIVALLVDRSLEMFLGIWGILKAGGAYLPIDPTYPWERIQFMLQDTGATLLLTDQPAEWQAQAQQADWQFAGEVWDLGSNHLYQGDGSNLPELNTAADLAYIIYTSGTTGRPKGNMTQHYNISRVVRETNYLEITETDRILQLSNYAFDGSTFDIFGAHLNGAVLVLIEKDWIMDLDQLTSYIHRQEISIFFVTTALFNTLVDTNLEALQQVQKILFGGEQVSVGHVRKALEVLGPGRLIHVYGPTESTVFATYCHLDQVPDQAETLPIGQALANTQVYILDQYLQPVPVGVPGEVCIGGDGLALGYLNRPELTEAKFVPHPWCPGERIYRTGDLAKWLPDGKVEFIGRIDQQVKIRGFRIEPGEIEERLRQSEWVRAAIVLPREDHQGEKYLCAYLVLTEDEENSVARVREELAQQLPAYMIPTHFLSLEQFPLTPNGKVNRQALPEPEGTGLSVEQRYQPPANEMEERLVRIWQEVLGIEQIGVQDHFFELGGHSLKATRLVGKIHKEFEIKLPLQQIFTTPTIRGLSEYIQQASQTLYQQIESIGGAGEYPTSSAQSRMYMLQMADRESITYNMPGVFVATGQLDLERIDWALNQLVQRHETLRTSFATVGGEVIQRVQPQVQLSLESVALRADQSAAEETSLERTGLEKATPAKRGQDGQSQEQTTLAEVSAAEFGHARVDMDKISLKMSPSERLDIDKFDPIAQLAMDSFVRPFDLSQAPLLRAGVLPLGQSQHLLLFDMHHIISDGTSMAILIEEFMQIYAGQELAPLRIQYKDYAVWHNQLLSSEQLDGQARYWFDQFADEIPTLNLPTDYPRPVVQSLEGRTLHIMLDRQLTQALHGLAQQTESTLYMVLFSALNILLARYSGQEDLVVGCPVAGRAQPDLEKILGMFINTLPVRNQPQGDLTYQDFLAQLRENTLQAFANQDYPLEKLVEGLDVRTDLSRNPLFDVIFVLQNMEQRHLQIPGLYLTPLEYATQTAKFDLSFLATELGVGYGIRIEVEYSSSLFEQSTVQRLCSHLVQILQEITNDSTVRLRHIELLTATERAQIMGEFNDTARLYPREKSISQLFAEQVAAHPDELAVVFAGEKLTYAELDQRANGLARVLRERGVEPDTLVGIIAERSLEMIVGVVAILKAGGAYLPIDPNDPPERIQYMVQDGGVEIMLSQGEFTKAELPCQVLNLLDQQLYTSTEPVADVSSATDLAYVIYTSGSTGQPKGVMVEQRSVVRLIRNTNYIEWQKGDKILQTGTLAFDASTFEIWGALLNGLELHLGAKELILHPEELEAYLADHQITVLWLTAPLFNFLADMRPGMFTGLRYLLSGGDVLSPKHINRVRREAPAVQLVNGYGPTENTTFSVCFPIDQEYLNNIPIGRPIANSTAYIFDQYQQLAPIGVPGELWVGGEGLARGYLNNPTLTAEKFVPNPFQPGTKLYRTGDLARWLPDGKIEFLGRIDQLVKIRGFRVEPGEIESQLLQLGQIDEAVVVPRTDEQGMAYLVAYLVAPEEVDLGRVREGLARVLPDYMIPATFMQIPQVPLTRNGKVDQKALPEPTQTQPFQTNYLAPRNQLEESLAFLWREILQVQRVGIFDDFFTLGGHSLKATILASRIREELQQELPLREVFQRPTIAGQAEYLQRMELTAAKLGLPPILPAPEQEFYPLSSAQQRLFILQQINPERIDYNMPMILHLQGQLDLPRLQQAWQQIVQRHAALRTTFTMVNGEPVQQVQTEVQVTIPRLESDGIELQRLFADFIQPFDLMVGPLFHTCLIQVAPDEHYWLLDLHHIITDGFSLQIMVQDFVRLYGGQELAELSLQYIDYAVWQRQFAASQLQKQEEYWVEELRDMVPTNFPGNNLVDLDQRVGEMLKVPLPRELHQSLEVYCQRHGLTKSSCLLAVFKVLLSQEIKQTDLTVGVPIAGRNHPGLERLIGLFLNVLVIRTQLESTQTFVDYARQVHHKMLLGQEHQDYPLDALYAKLNEEEQLQADSFFSIMFNYIPFDPQTALELPGCRIKSVDLPKLEAKYDLVLYAQEGTTELEFRLLYRKEYYDPYIIQRLLTDLVDLLEQVLADDELLVQDLELQVEDELLEADDDFEAFFDETDDLLF